MDGAEFDARMMRLAIATARRGLGRTAPNPAVGAVVADPKTQTVIARAVTAAGGRPHAEPQALSQAGQVAEGATLYVTLEPCSHVGETPPCVEAIIAAGIKRVVVGLQDPDTRVAGNGLAQLRAARIAVQSGVCARQAKWLTQGHNLRVTQRRPFVQLKMALASDGTVPRGSAGQPTWVTGPLSRAVGHQLRANTDAILIGAATLRDDDPTLTCRLPGLEAYTPVRVVVTSDPDVNTGSQLDATREAAPVWLAYEDGTGTSIHDAPKRARQAVRSAPGGAGVEQVALDELLEDLADRGITRLLVEGGPKMWRWFQDGDRVDEVVAFVAATNRHTTGTAEAVQAMVRAHLGRDPGAAVSARTLGPDACFTFRPA